MNELYIETGTTRIAACTIGGEGTRRERERRAAAHLASSLTGREVAISHDASGAPRVDGDSIHISISHSAHTAAVVVDSSHRIGIDAEDVRGGQLRRVAARVLSSAELAEYGCDDVWLTRAWTLKEALYKAAGVAGADWRTDLRLPSTKDGRRAYACGREYEQDYAGQYDGTLITVVREAD